MNLDTVNEENNSAKHTGNLEFYMVIGSRGNFCEFYAALAAFGIFST